MQTLKHFINKYRATYAEWLATTKDGDLETDNEQYDLFAEAELALVEYQCADLAEAQAKTAFFRQTRELMDTIGNDRTAEGKTYLSLFLASVSVETAVSPDLAALIEAHKGFKLAFEDRFEQDCDTVQDSKEMEAWLDSEREIIALPCHSIEDVRAKAAFMLTDPSIVESASGYMMQSLLLSLADASVDKSKNGEN